jgi:hypothetical protein
VLEGGKMAKTAPYTVTDPRGVEYTVMLTEKTAKARGAKKVVAKRGGRAAADDSKSDSKS